MAQVADRPAARGGAARGRERYRYPAWVVIGSAVFAVASLVRIAGLDVHALWGVASGTTRPGAGGLDWWAAVVLTGAVFLPWFAVARHNALSYAPVRRHIHSGWAVGGWLLPGAFVVLPVYGLVDTLAGTRARVDAPDGRLPTAARWLVGAWWTVWLGMWASLFVMAGVLRRADEARAGSTAGCYAAYAVLHALSAVAALGMAAFVGYVSAGQVGRRAEPVHTPPRPPSVRHPLPAFVAAAALGTVMGTLVLRHVLLPGLFGELPGAVDWRTPRYALAEPQVVGRWQPGDAAHAGFRELRLLADGTAAADRVRPDGSATEAGRWRMVPDGGSITLSWPQDASLTLPDRLDTDESTRAPVLVFGTQRFLDDRRVFLHRAADS
ncbi:DUF4328 domain-containing protein [Yinghuangia seranimata]|uniref:DUF4328 domain-containing protein n=1 Tax=Yinghuangia seranimata TaxID=408067 RepID=UPI00248D17F5|nr:DUF4328 domain-containing protein [Yinghuangia seranimata]MDI2132826.1 DUF4328 domain-containing protein [Yinghuangia seranimata]